MEEVLMILKHSFDTVAAHRERAALQMCRTDPLKNMSQILQYYMYCLSV